MIRSVEVNDAGAIADIYNHYVLHTVVTFEEKKVSEAEMRKRIRAVSDLPWLVFEERAQVQGYAHASRWKSRCAYKYSLETSVYLPPGAQGQGIGHMLYQQLIDQLKDSGYHALIGGIALPNEPSIALHKKLGFRKIGQFEQVGYKFGRWVDVGYWQLIF